MFKKYLPLIPLAFALSAQAETNLTVDSEVLIDNIAPTIDKAKEKELFVSGSFTVGYSTNYTGRGYVVSHSVAEGDGIAFSALKLDFNIADRLSLHSTIAYTPVLSGHTLYGAAEFGPTYNSFGLEGPIKEANIENEFVVKTELRYEFIPEIFSVGIGHDYIHGGLLGVMAKHYADQGASSVNEFFINPRYTPTKWLELSVPVNYSTQGIVGWWFEPSITFKAPIVGTPEDVKVAALLTFSMSATASYFSDWHHACENGDQAYWIKLSTPWFITDDKSLILTPSVSFHWLGNGGIAANKGSEFRQYSENPNNVPFRNFGVVGSVSLTYKF